MEKDQPQLLTEIQAKLEKALTEGKNLNEDDLAYYKAIKKIIDLKINEQEVKEVFKEFQDFIFGLAKGNFSKRLQVENEKDLFSYLASGLNFLAEELEVRTIPCELLELGMERVMAIKPNFALITLVDGKIKYAIKNPQSLLGYSKEQLMNSRIQNFISTNIQFLPYSDSRIKDQEIILRNSDSKEVPAFLTIEELDLPNQISPYYLYMIREKEAV